MMTLKEIVNGKTYPFIEHRILQKDKQGKLQDILNGYFAYENNNIIPLSIDCISLDDVIFKHQEFITKNQIEIKNKVIPIDVTCLTIWENIENE